MISIALIFLLAGTAYGMELEDWRNVQSLTGSNGQPRAQIWTMKMLGQLKEISRNPADIAAEKEKDDAKKKREERRSKKILRRKKAQAEANNHNESEYASEKPRSKGHTIGKYFYSGHALDRMQERGVNAATVADIIGHSDRYRTLEDTQLIVDTSRGIAIILDPLNNTVITVMNNYSAEHLARWIAQRNNATKEEKIAAQKAHAANVKRAAHHKPEHPYPDYELHYGYYSR